MDYKGLRVLMLDGYGRQSAAILTELHELGCVITTLNDSKLDIGYASRYPKHKIVEHGLRNDDELLKSVIEREMFSGKYDVILPLIERSTVILTEMQENGRIPENVKVIVAPRKAFLQAYDKEATMFACQRIGVPCPRTKMDDETLDEYLSKVKFPLACKPRVGSGSAGFKKVESREMLQQYIDEGIIDVSKYVIQEYIPQEGTRYSCRIFLDKQQNVIFNVEVQGFRSFPVDGGPGCYCRSVNRQDVKDYSELLLKELGWIGLAHVCFMYDPRDETPKVVEINGRIPSGIRICNLVGVHPVKAMLDLAFDQKMEPYTHTYPEGIALRHSQADIMWLMKSPNRFKAKPSWFDFRKNHDYVFSWRDPWPWFTYSIEHMRTYKKDMKKRKH